MTPTQEQALTDAKVEWANRSRSDRTFVQAIFLAGYALGAQERQAQDARICRELGAMQQRAFETIAGGLTTGHRYIEPTANAIALRIEITPTEQ